MQPDHRLLFIFHLVVEPLQCTPEIPLPGQIPTEFVVEVTDDPDEGKGNNKQNVIQDVKQNRG